MKNESLMLLAFWRLGEGMKRRVSKRPTSYSLAQYRGKKGKESFQFNKENLDRV